MPLLPPRRRPPGGERRRRRRRRAPAADRLDPPRGARGSVISGPSSCVLAFDELVVGRAPRGRSRLLGSRWLATSGLDLDLRVELRHRRLLRAAAAELADDDGEDEDEDGRADAEADDERRGALVGGVVFAVRPGVFRVTARPGEGVLAGAALRRTCREMRRWFLEWTRETLTKSLLSSPLTTVSVSLSSPPYARAKRRRERRAARARTRRRRMGIPHGRGRR